MNTITKQSLEKRVAKILSESYARAGREQIWTSEETDTAIRQAGDAAKRLIKSAKELKITDQKILEIAGARIPKGSLSVLPPKLAHKEDAK